MTKYFSYSDICLSKYLIDEVSYQIKLVLLKDAFIIKLK